MSEGPVGRDEGPVAPEAGRSDVDPERPAETAAGRRARFVGLGLALGAGIGAAIGAATDDLGTWLAVGVGVGLALGAGLGAAGSDH